MASKLEIYQGCLRLLGPHQLLSLSESTPNKLRLDEAWDSVVIYCLKRGLWNFAIRSVELLDDEDVESRFGWDYAFSHPTDMLRLVNISDQAILTQFEQFENETGYFFANVDTLYLRYISNEESYGLNIGAWPEDFCEVVKARLAFETALAITGDRGLRQDALALFDKNLSTAKTLDAIDERVKFKPEGRLVRARLQNGRGQHG